VQVFAKGSRLAGGHAKGDVEAALNHVQGLLNCYHFRHKRHLSLAKRFF
jgi:hypothetical protein